MKSIFLRNFLATALMIGICFLIIGISFLSIGRTFILNEYSSDMRNAAEEVVRMTSASYSSDGSDMPTLKLYIVSVAKGTGNTIMIADTSGEIQLSSELSGDSYTGLRVSDQLLQELESGSDINRLDTLGGVFPSKQYVVAAPVESSESGERLGYVFVSNRLDNILAAWNQLLNIIVAIGLSVFVIVLLMAMLYWRRMSRPLDEISAASRKFARGDFSVRVKQVEDPENELGALIDSFNKMADSLESAEKRRSEFISNISHELRTPMTTIGGFADGLLDGTIPEEDSVKYLTAIRDETDRLSRLVRNMLDASRAAAKQDSTQKRTDFDLTELIVQTMLSFETRATAKNLDVDPQLPDDRIMVRADKDAITRVIYNLIDNAVKFANKGSCITIRLYKDDEKAYVAIKDEGETIPPDDLPYIFDRFHKSDRSRSIDKDGVGLGLYLVKQIINEHDQDIAVRSENGTTEFTFTLALAK